MNENDRLKSVAEMAALAFQEATDQAAAQSEAYQAKKDWLNAAFETGRHSGITSALHLLEACQAEWQGQTENMDGNPMSGTYIPPIEPRKTDPPEWMRPPPEFAPAPEGGYSAPQPSVNLASSTKPPKEKIMKRNVTPTGWAWIISISVVLFVGWLVWPSQTQAPDPVTAAPKAPAPAGVAAAPTEKQAEDAFAGLGATEAAFAAGHNTTAPAQPTPGIAVYQVDATNPAGRVIAYSVQITATPPMGNRERMFLVEGDNLDLPDYPVLVRETSTCHVLKSATLKRLIGQPYARVTTTTGTDTAQIESVARPTC